MTVILYFVTVGVNKIKGVPLTSFIIQSMDSILFIIVIGLFFFLYFAIVIVDG